MKPTADQVIREFDELSAEDQRRVYVTITERNGGISSAQTNDPESFNKWMKQVLAVPLQITPTSDEDRNQHNTGVQKVLWNKTSIDFVPNKYIHDPKEIWSLESILGPNVLYESLRNHQVLDANLIEQLFTETPHYFYVNQPETFLFSTYGDLDESAGGPLKQLTALDALQRYGLQRLEESKEKQYVRL